MTLIKVFLSGGNILYSICRMILKEPTLFVKLWYFISVYNCIKHTTVISVGPGVAKWLRHCATSRTVSGLIPGGVTWYFFRGSPRRNREPWGRVSPWKWLPGISPGVKAAGAYGWRPTAFVVLKVKKIRGLNRPGTPWASSGLLWETFTFTFTVMSVTERVGSWRIVSSIGHENESRIRNMMSNQDYRLLKLMTCTLLDDYRHFEGTFDVQLHIKKLMVYGGIISFFAIFVPVPL
jgi:hypothetical protein